MRWVLLGLIVWAVVMMLFALWVGVRLRRSDRERW